MAPPIYKLLSVMDVVYLIAEHLHNFQDVLNLCLTCKPFGDAAYPCLYRSVNLPQLSVKARRRNKKQFYELFAQELARYTRAVHVDGYRVAAETIDSIRWTHSCWDFQDSSHVELKTKLDRIFDGIDRALACTPRLRAFSSEDIPRSLDLLILLQRNCPNIESIEISPREDDVEGLHINDLCRSPKPGTQALTRPEARGYLFPLWNGVNMKIPPSLSPAFDLPKLTCLSLAGMRYPYDLGFYVKNLVSLLKGSPNLKCLTLRGYTHGKHRRDFRRPRYAYAYYETLAGPPGGWPDLPEHLIFAELLPSICRRYELSGAKPLKLRYLKLEDGAELTGDISTSDPSPDRPHYLACLLDLSCLEELHLDFHDQTTSAPSWSPHAVTQPAEPAKSCFLWPDAIRLITEGHLRRLRKLSIPSTDGLVWPMLAKIDRELAAKLIVRVHWMRWSYAGSAFQMRERNGYFKNLDCLGDFSGFHVALDSPGSGWGLGKVPYLPPTMTQTRSLRVRIPTTSLDDHDPPPATIPAATALSMLLDEIIELFPTAPELREMWIFNLGEDMGRIMKWEFGRPEVFCRRFAERLVDKYSNLGYVRVGNLAWWIYRPVADGDDESPPEFMPVPKRFVEEDIPWSFQTCPPLVIS